MKKSEELISWFIFKEHISKFIFCTVFAQLCYQSKSWIGGSIRTSLVLVEWKSDGFRARVQVLLLVVCIFLPYRAIMCLQDFVEQIINVIFKSLTVADQLLGGMTQTRKNCWVEKLFWPTIRRVKKIIGKHHPTDPVLSIISFLFFGFPSPNFLFRSTNARTLYRLTC